MNNERRTALLSVIAAIGILGLFFAGRIPQDPAYHLFADTRTIAGLANFWNVVSNLPFLAVGVFGLWRLPLLTQAESRSGYLLLCASVTLVGLGSAYYHHAPSNASLLWDRLPMTVAFMALFAMLLGERVITRYKQAWPWSLVLLGIGAALYWSWTESRGVGDLRPYAVVQFLPVILMPLILLLFSSRYLGNPLLLCAFALYFAAKALEHFDKPMQSLTGIVSGHSLKHVVAAVAVLCIILSVPARSTRRVATLGLLALALVATPVHAKDARDQFFASLQGLCGARFEGAKTFPTDSQDDFAGKRLVANFASCSDSEVRVPFLVGEDHSRTWVFTRTAGGLQLQHDHRHADGTPDAITMYGGMASSDGTSLAQSFVADSHTASLIPAARTNVWTVSLSADASKLTYHLERDAKPRFTAVLERARDEPVVVYRGATLIDVVTGRNRDDAAIVVRGERIQTIAAAAGYRIPKGAAVVDVSGRYVVPGFINAHVHLATPPERPYALAMLRRDVYGGVTAVRGMGDDARAMADLARGSRVGEFPGPEVLYPSLFAGPGFFEDPRVQSSSQGETAGRIPWMREIHADSDLAEAVTLARGSGASAIKVYANLDAASVGRIVAEAHRQGLPAWAHGAVFPASPLEVVQAGADTVSHVCMIAYQAQAMPATYHHRADVDESRLAGGMPPAVDAVFSAMKQRGTILDATLYVYLTIERMRAEMPKGEGPPIYCSSKLAGRIARAAHAAGVEIAVGTDAPAPGDDPYPAVQREMELLVEQAGMSPLQVLRSATLVGARSLGREADMGTIEPGKLANLVFLAADPSRDISATRQVVLTVKRGRGFARDAFVSPSARELGIEAP